MKPLILYTIDSDWDSIPDRLYLAKSLTRCNSLESLVNERQKRAIVGRNRIRLLPSAHDTFDGRTLTTGIVLLFYTF